MRSRFKRERSEEDGHLAASCEVRRGGACLDVLVESVPRERSLDDLAVQDGARFDKDSI